MKSQPQFDTKRWWFLSKDGFDLFQRDRVSQGYEVMARLPDFPHILTKVEGAEEVVVHDVGWRSVRPAWPELSATAQRAFQFDYKFDLQRMGFLDVVWVGRTVTFDCRRGSPSITAGLERWVADHPTLVPRQFEQRLVNRDGKFRVRVPATYITFTPPRPSMLGHMVSVDLGRLLRYLDGKTACSWKNVSRALRTFLDRDQTYINYRRRCMTGKRKQADGLNSRLHDPAGLALGLAAWDLRCAGHQFRSIYRALPERVWKDVLGRWSRVGTYWRDEAQNCVNSLKKLWGAQQSYPIPTTPLKQGPTTGDPIDVMSTLRLNDL